MYITGLREIKMGIPVKMISLDRSLEFSLANDTEFLASLPAQPAVFATGLLSTDSKECLDRTHNLREYFERFIRQLKNVRPAVVPVETKWRVRYRVTGSPLEEALVLYHQAKKLFPSRYLKCLEPITPAVLKLDASNEVAPWSVSEAVQADGALYIGPLPSNEEAALLASEMNSRLAHFFVGTIVDQGHPGLLRVVDFLKNSAGSFRSQLRALKAMCEREAEGAAYAWESQIAFLRRREADDIYRILQAVPELPRDIDALDAVIVQPAAEEGSVAFFVVRGGFFTNLIVMPLAWPVHEHRQVEEILRILPGSSGVPSSEASTRGGKATEGESLAELGEHLAILAAWFYGEHRAGEIFFPEPVPGGRPVWPCVSIKWACSFALPLSGKQHGPVLLHWKG